MPKMQNVLTLLRADRSGVALVEFALAAPVLLFMVLGGLELVNFELDQLKVNQIAMTVADNAGRVTTGIDEANIYEVMAGANVIGESMDFEKHGRIVLSSLQDNEQKGGKHGQMINWQRCWGDLGVDPAYGTEGKGRNDASLPDGMGADGNTIAAIDGTAVMFVEVSYDYQPLISDRFLPLSGTIRRESAFNVRGRQDNDISNSQNLKTLSCS